MYKDRDGQTGIVDFAYEEDMRHAVRKLDDTEFERGCYIRVKEDDPESPRGGRDRDRSRSPVRDRSPRRPRSRSPAPAASRSPARSRR